MKFKASPFVSFSKTHSKRPVTVPFSTLTFPIRMAAGLVIFASPSAWAASQTWDGGAGTNALQTAANWDADGTFPTSAETASFGNLNGTGGDLVLTYDNNFTGGTNGVSFSVLSTHTGTIAIDPGTNTTSMRFKDITLASGAGSLTFGNGDVNLMNMTFGSGNAGFTSNTLVNNSAAATVTFKSDTRFGSGGAGPGSTRAISFDGAGNWQIDSVFKPSTNNAQGGFLVTKKGTGTLAFNNTNTGNNTATSSAGTGFQSLAIEQGTVLAGANGALGGGGSTVGATIGQVTLGQGNTNSATLLNTGAFSQANNIVVPTGNTGTITLGGNHTTGTSAYTGNITLGSNVLLNAASGGRVDFNVSGTNLISGSGNVTITGGGVVAMAGVNTYTGTTTIENGTLRATGASSLGTSASPIALGTATSISSNFSPTLRVNGLTTLSRDVIVGASTAATTGTYMIDTDNGVSAVSLAGNVTLNQDLTISGNTTGGFTIAGNITTGSSDAQTVTFAGSGGRLIASGAIGGGAGEISVVKNGGTALTLTGTSTYTGATTVNAGTLFANGSLGNTAVSVNAGTLAGSGAIAGSVTVGAASYSAGGLAATSGSLEIAGDLTLGSGTTTLIELGGTAFSLNGTEEYDRTKLTGSTPTLSLDGTLSISFLNSFALGDNQAFGIFQLESGTTLTGLFSGLAEGGLVGNFGGKDLFITYAGNFGDTGTVDTSGGNDIVLYTVPEPGTAAL
ncbi:MAG: hypothetical protein EOP83_17605, partial [Verrucomicrobiaceae bacterium]